MLYDRLLPPTVMVLWPLLGRVLIKLPEELELDDEELELELELELEDELELDEELDDEELELLEDELLDDELLEDEVAPPCPPQPTRMAASRQTDKGKRVTPDLGFNNLAIRCT
jgi:hypothetical protein